MLKDFMAHQEIILPDRFQPFPGHREQSKIPTVVADSTSQVLQMYFKEELINPTVARNYLASDTTDFIYGAQKGFFRDFNRITRDKNMTRDDMDRIMGLARPHFRAHDLEDSEAFGFSIVIFAALPYFAKHDLLPQGFSKDGVLAPPSTTMEFNIRLNELKEEIGKIVSGETAPTTHIEARNSLWRTYTFFNVGKDLPLHLENSADEIKDTARATFENLLGNLKINLD